MKVNRSEVDGVPTFWVDTGDDTQSATLCFRSGLADEPIPQRGWTHLIEHLSLSGVSRSVRDVDGGVDLLCTELDR